MRLWRRTNALSERRFGCDFPGSAAAASLPFSLLDGGLRGSGLADFEGVRKRGGGQGKGARQGKRATLFEARKSLSAHRFGWRRLFNARPACLSARDS